jgi:hypothetical protein
MQIRTPFGSAATSPAAPTAPASAPAGSARHARRAPVAPRPARAASATTPRPGLAAPRRGLTAPGTRHAGRRPSPGPAHAELAVDGQPQPVAVEHRLRSGSVGCSSTRLLRAYFRASSGSGAPDRSMVAGVGTCRHGRRVTLICDAGDRLSADPAGWCRPTPLAGHSANASPSGVPGEVSVPDGDPWKRLRPRRAESQPGNGRPNAAVAASHHASLVNAGCPPCSSSSSMPTKFPSSSNEMR